MHGHVKGALELIAQHLNRTDLFAFHCMNHKLELAVHEAVYNEHQQSLASPHVPIDTLYAYYSRSLDNCRILAGVSETLDTEVRKIGKVFDVRWLSSSYRGTVGAVFVTYSGCICCPYHLLNANADVRA